MHFASTERFRNTGSSPSVTTPKSVRSMRYEMTPGRRSFFQTVATVAGGLASLIVAVPVVRFLFDPLKRRPTGGTFIRVAELSSIPNNRPVRVVVVSDRWDGYTHFPPGPIGSVWLIAAATDTGEAGLPTSPGAPGALPVRCLQTICPHLGCGTDYVPDRGTFACPCHASDFDLSGRRLEGPSPRDLDELECRVTEPDAEGRRWVEVKFEKFQTGVATKRAVT